MDINEVSVWLRLALQAVLLGMAKCLVMTDIKWLWLTLQFFLIIKWSLWL